MVYIVFTVGSCNMVNLLDSAIGTDNYKKHFTSLVHNFVALITWVQ